MPEAASTVDLVNRILEKITPGDHERNQIEVFCSEVEEELSKQLSEAGFQGVAEVHGSIAHGTWLSGERDIDVFLILEKKYDKNVFPSVLELVKDYIGDEWTEAYAEHPYLKAKMKGFNVEFIPSFRLEPNNDLKSSTDRTPLHTDYIKENISPEEQDQTRLLKKFMKGIGVYGAEVKVRGFSGYLCELLVLFHGSFLETLKGASEWKKGHVIDLKGESDPDSIKKKFGEPLIVLDPVDSKRNVASAVSEESMWNLTAASRAFIGNPSESFFEEQKARVSVQDVLSRIQRHDLNLMFTVIEDPEPDVPDVLWGQLYRTEKILVRNLNKKGFKVTRSRVWSNEDSKHILVIELENPNLPAVQVHDGPPVERVEDSKNFLETHLANSYTLTGPWIKGERWQVGIKRKDTKAPEYVRSMLENGGRKTGISNRLAGKIQRSNTVLMNKEIEDFMDEDFAALMDRFLIGRPAWLE
jgi:tRNA nucleotidyltransferase (CCA-adding enzyme)